MFRSRHPCKRAPGLACEDRLHLAWPDTLLQGGSPFRYRTSRAAGCSVCMLVCTRYTCVSGYNLALSSVGWHGMGRVMSAAMGCVNARPMLSHLVPPPISCRDSLLRSISSKAHQLSFTSLPLNGRVSFFHRSSYGSMCARRPFCPGSHHHALKVGKGGGKPGAAGPFPVSSGNGREEVAVAVAWSPGTCVIFSALSLFVSFPLPCRYCDLLHVIRLQWSLDCCSSMWVVSSVISCALFDEVIVV